MGRAAAACGATPRFFIGLADVESSRYTLLIDTGSAPPPDREQFREAVDHELGRLNLEYAQKRASGRLKPLEVRAMRPGFGEAYKRFCVERGQREGQWKALTLQYASEFDFPFEELARS